MATAVVISREKILTVARTLPASPQVLSGLCELLQDANSDLDQIANQIRFDPVLAARVVRISNSPVFGGGAKIGSVDEAVNRVGFGEILRLVGAAAVTGLVDRSLDCYGIEVTLLRENLLYHALAGEALARWTDIDPRVAYMAGLTRAVGMLVLDRIARELKPTISPYSSKNFGAYTQWEQQTFGLTNLDVTGMILEEWRFPASTIAAIRNHHLQTATSCEDRFGALLNRAGLLTIGGGVALPGELFCWADTPEKVAAAGFDAEQVQSDAERVREVFEQQRDTLN